jgi:membrane protease YdiL (CAAX protease family)
MTFIKNNPLTSYFILVFLIMYGLTSVEIFHLFEMSEIILWILGSSAPTISAIIIAYLSDGKMGISNLFKPFLIYKVRFKWYFAAFVITLLSTIISIAYLLLNNIDIPVVNLISLIPILLMTFIMGPLVEEAGWTGFALPKLQAKFSALTASLILGFLWAVWHLPLWFLPDSSQSTMSFGLFLVVLVAVRIIMGWAYNNTRGSIFIAVVFHFFFNLGNTIGVDILGVPMNHFLYLAGSGLVIYAVWVVIIAGPADLSRKHKKIIW